MHNKHTPYWPIALIPVLTAMFASIAWAEDTLDSYLELEFEDLLQREVTSVSKKKQKLSEAAAAIFVITQNDIRRSGVTSIAEALRMAPGIQVARIDSNKWAISSRGFNSQIANKLLVLIDGRSVYIPSFSGVYWDSQDTLLEDIDRIEVIRGPGAAVWGANAVNGVINIITKQASETTGVLLTAGAGNEEKGFASLRYGTKLNENTHGRAYFKFNNRDDSYTETYEGDAGDDWQSFQGGFRLDGTLGTSKAWTLQGDLYDVDGSQTIQGVFLDPALPENSAPWRDFNIPSYLNSSGWNLLGRWQHRSSDDSSASLQVFYDHNKREELVLDQQHDTFDIDFQHRFSPKQGHDVVWGLGYRHIEDKFRGSFSFSIAENTKSFEIFSAFIQDEIALNSDTLSLIIGSKFEHNDFTGFEAQPNVRFLWTPKSEHSIWASVSRAIRTPSRVERNSRIPVAIVPFGPPPAPPLVVALAGDEETESESLLAYELGYRVQPSENISVDLSLFYNEYDDVTSFESDSSSPVISFDNQIKAKSCGVELAIDWRVNEWWRLQTNYSHIQLSHESDASSTTDTLSPATIEGASPENQISLGSAMDISNNISLNLWLYYVDELSATNFDPDVTVPNYTSVNLRFAWQPMENLELSIVGQNLSESRHSEFVGRDLIIPSEIERSLLTKIRWHF